ncbi:MAG: pyridoxal-dependent decarboxylase [Phycisphaerales bacterium JB040]
MPQPPHMTRDQFRAQAERMLDWAERYWDSLDERPVTPAGGPGDLLGVLPDAPPESTPNPDDEWDAIRRDLDRLVVPNLLHWQSPRFFGYFPCNASGPGTLGVLAGAVLNVNGMLWATSPAATELETRLLDWCVGAFALPERFLSTHASGGTQGGGCIQGTASESTLIAMLAGRDRARRAGHEIGSLRVYTSDQAHSSVVKGAMIAGLALGPDDRSQVRLIPTDASGAMLTDALRDAVAGDLARGGVPCSVTATLGTTGTEGVDPLPAIADAIAELCPDPKPWLHVDGAYTGAALVCPEFGHLARGLERADSLCLNPHKWLLTNFDCDLFWTADRAGVTAALSLTPEYLRNEATDAGSVIDYRDWQIPLGRSFRALKLWFVLRHYGLEGLRAYIRGHVALAESLERRLGGDPRFRLVGTRRTALVCFRMETDALTEGLVRAVNARGRVFLSHTRFADGGHATEPRYVARVAIGGARTEGAHVDEAMEEIDRAATALLA